MWVSPTLRIGVLPLPSNVSFNIHNIPMSLWISSARSHLKPQIATGLSLKLLLVSTVISRSISVISVILPARLHSTNRNIVYRVSSTHMVALVIALGVHWCDILILRLLKGLGSAIIPMGVKLRQNIPLPPSIIIRAVSVLRILIFRGVVFYSSRLSYRLPSLPSCTHLVIDCLQLHLELLLLIQNLLPCLLEPPPFFYGLIILSVVISLNRLVPSAPGLRWG